MTKDNSKKARKGNKKNDQVAMLGETRIRRKGRNKQMVVNIGTINVLMLSADGAMKSMGGDPMLLALREAIKNDRGGPGCTCTAPLGTLAPPETGNQPKPGEPTEPAPKAGDQPDASGGGAAEAEAQPPEPAPVPAQPPAEEQERVEEQEQ